MKLPIYDKFLDSKISEMTAEDYVKAIDSVVAEFKPFKDDMRRANKDFYNIMKDLKSQGRTVNEFIKAGLSADTSMKVVGLMTNRAGVFIQLERS